MKTKSGEAEIGRFASTIQYEVSTFLSRQDFVCTFALGGRVFSTDVSSSLFFLWVFFPVFFARVIVKLEFRAIFFLRRSSGESISQHCRMWCMVLVEVMVPWSRDRTCSRSHGHGHRHSRCIGITSQWLLSQLTIPTFGSKGCNKSIT